MFRRLFSSTLLVAVLASLTFAQTTAPAPSVDKLREHVTYLASDKLEGRRTGTAGSNAAAEYIAGEFSKLRLQPFAPSMKSTRQSDATMNNYRQDFLTWPVWTWAKEML